MRILAISDIYGNENIVRELKEKLNYLQIDIVVIAGGISYIEEYNALNILEMFLNIGNKVLFVPGGTDNKKIEIFKSNIINLDHTIFLDRYKDFSIGFMGIGGVPHRSIKKPFEFPYRWIEMIYREELLKELEIKYQKLKFEDPDYIILISHSPPYHIADYSKKIVLSDFDTIKLDVETKDQIKKSNNPVFLGSHILREFIRNHKIDIHIFGHIHKQGATKIIKNDTIFVNVSHLSPTPYKLTGRKACIIEISKRIDLEFINIVNERLDFDEFLQTYL